MGRRALATSVVVTVSSLFELACTPSGGTLTHNPPPPEEELISRNPPDPSNGLPEAQDSGEQPEEENTDVEAPKTWTQVVQREDGVCVQEVVCADGIRCNPPPPTVVPCPAEVLPDAAPSAQVQRRDDGSCWEFHDVKCPEGATCNPPPPRQVRCPSEDHLPQATDPARVKQRANGECWESFTMKCPEGARCNPPPPRKVQCPPPGANEK
jgi:hypothetical protein